MVYTTNLQHHFNHSSQQTKENTHRTKSTTLSRAQLQFNPSTNRRASLVALTIAIPLVATDIPSQAASTPPFPSPSPSSQAVATTDLFSITDRVYLDIGMCPEAIRQNRTLGDKSVLCSDPVSLGRLNIGLYGDAAPGTVATFKTLISSGALNGTQFSKILPGQWLIAGKQGSKRQGFLEPPPEIQQGPSNPDLLNSSAFKLRHTRPGILSLNLSENEDEDGIRLRPGYKALSFIITAGPGAVALDGENIVFGQVEGGGDGVDVVSAICSVPTFSPSQNMLNYNKFAMLLGDDRAEKVRKTWGRPLKAVVITGSGLL